MSLGTFFVFLSLCILGFSHPPRHDFGQSLLDRCRFTLADQEFNLCPIIEDTRERIPQAERSTSFKHDRMIYSFTLAGSSGKTGTSIPEVGLDRQSSRVPDSPTGALMAV
jgi:hypothetical protein